MTNRLQTNVRLVKCPKCAKILPEPAQVPLYTCGGCGTVLQAKYYRSNNQATGLGSQGDDTVRGDGIYQAPDGGESCDLRHRSRSAGQQSSYRNEGRNHTAVENSNSDQNGSAMDSSHHTSLSNGKLDDEVDQSDRTVFENKEDEERDATTNSGLEDDDSQDELCVDVGVENHIQEQNGDVNSCRETSVLNESRVLENKKTSYLALNHTVPENSELQQVAVVDGAIKDGDDQHEVCDDSDYRYQNQVGDVNPAGKVSVSKESQAVENKEPLQLAALRSGATGDESDHEMLAKTREEQLEGKHSHEIIKLSSEALCSTEITSGGSVNSTPGIEPKLEEACRNDGASSSSSSPSASELRITGEMCSASVHHVESKSLDNGIETSGKKIEKVRSANTHREVEGSLKGFPRSPTKGSLAYDGSVSSFDGNDDQVPEQQEHIGEKTLPEESPEWNNPLPSRMTCSSSGIQSREAKRNSSMLLNEKLKSSSWLEEEEPLVEPLVENGISWRTRIRQNRNGLYLPPRVPYYRRRSTEVAYETGSSSSYIHDENPMRNHHHHPYRYYEDPEPWLRKAYPQKGTFDRRRGFPEPGYYNYESTSGEIYHRGRYNNHGYTERRRRSESWSQMDSLPRMPSSYYSGEVFNGRYQIRDPYMPRHHPDDLRYWRQGLCMAPSRETRWDPYDFMGTESYDWGAHDTISVSDDDLRKFYYLRREKRQQPIVKRRVLPSAGAAPFITCYFCFKVLQLPKDFLISRRSSRKRVHRLKCGACSSILEFSLENECCLAPNMPNANQASSHTNHSRGSSLITGEDGKLASHNFFSDDGNLVSHDSFREAGREKSKLMARNSRKEGSGEGSDYAAAAGESGRSRQVKVTWQLPARSKSPLHRLMGYSSPQDLLNGTEYEDLD